MSQKPVTAIIVGAGHRSFVYSELAITNPELLKIVGVADPNPVRRKKAMEHFGFGEDMCFESAQELATKGKLADAVINGTMDEQHLETAVPLLNCGYDMLLEKPFAVNEDEMWQIVNCARENNSKVMICHVLRYTPFYYSIKERIHNGEIGDVKMQFLRDFTRFGDYDPRQDAEGGGQQSDADDVKEAPPDTQPHYVEDPLI